VGLCLSPPPIRRKRESPIPVPEKRSTFSCVHNETLSVVAVRVCNPVVKAEDVSPAAKLALLDSTFLISMK
jgi:hypothetical protein